MRDEMMGAVVRRAIEHPEFRKRLVDNPKAALDDHGFVLEGSDMAEIERVGKAGEENAERELIALAERLGIQPREN
jgi:hypothetical protein